MFKWDIVPVDKSGLGKGAELLGQCLAPTSKVFWEFLKENHRILKNKYINAEATNIQ